jgi:hypothetical protein
MYKKVLKISPHSQQNSSYYQSKKEKIMANQKITFLDYNLDAVDDCDKPRAIFYQFKEHNEIIKLIEKFPSLIDDLRAKEKSYERFLCKFKVF